MPPRPQATKKKASGGKKATTASNKAKNPRQKPTSSSKASKYSKSKKAGKSSTSSNKHVSAGGCDCTYCLYADDQDARRDVDERNDKRIGWPQRFALHDESTEFPLRLSGYSEESRLEIMNALFTLGKHGISLADLVAGSAKGNEFDEVEEEERAEAGLAQWRRIGNGEEEEPNNADVETETMNHCAAQMKLVRVGRNFVDFELPKHHVDPAHYYGSSDFYKFEDGSEWPDVCVREMQPATDAAADDKVVYRILSSGRPATDYDIEHLSEEAVKHPPIARAIYSIKESIFDNRLRKVDSEAYARTYGLYHHSPLEDE